ncbi:AgmX/PglI C-terminal domain-containing protein [Aurantivibrio plasticivorans]
MFANVEPLALELVLPWQEDAEQEEKYKRLIKRILIGVMLFCFIVPWLPTIDPAYEPPEKELTKTKVMLEPVKMPPPEPAAPPPKPKPVTPKEQPVQQVVKAAPAPTPAPAPKAVDKKQLMKEQGLASLSNQLSALRGSVNVAKMQRKNVSKSDLGQKEFTSRDAFGEEVIGKRSQGIEVNEAMLKQESAGLAAYDGVAVTVAGVSDQPGKSTLSYLSGQAGRRDMENIRRTFEAAKSSVYARYLEALNQHPELAGKFIFRLIIEPDGSISDLKLVTSELGMHDLELAILSRIRDINFGEKEVSPTAVEYAFSFIPS